MSEPLAMLTSILLAAAAAPLTAWVLLAVVRPALPEPGSRIGHLDGLRGVLALMVIAPHFAIWMTYWDDQVWSPPDLPFLRSLGRTAVAVFFMISAALFYGRVRSPMDRQAWTRLYLSRGFRIFPLYLVAIGLVILTFHLGGDRLQAGDGGRLLGWVVLFKTYPIMDNLDTSRPLNVSWTLRYEWLFYASLPLFAALLRWVPGRAARVAVLCALLVASHFVFWCLPYFFLGMLAVEALEVGALRRLFLSRGAAFLALAVLVLELVRPDAIDPLASAALSGALLWAAFVPLLGGAAGLGEFGRPTMVALGEWSFGIYLLHNLVLYVAFGPLSLRLLPDGLAWFALPPVTAATVALASLAHGVVEKPFMAVGRTVAAVVARGGGRAPAAGGVPLR